MKIFENLADAIAAVNAAQDNANPYVPGTPAYVLWNQYWAPQLSTWKVRGQMFDALGKRFPHLPILVYTTTPLADGRDALLVEVFTRGKAWVSTERIYEERVPATMDVLDELAARIALIAPDT